MGKHLRGDVGICHRLEGWIHLELRSKERKPSGRVMHSGLCPAGRNALLRSLKLSTRYSTAEPSRRLGERCRMKMDNSNIRLISHMFNVF